MYKESEKLHTCWEMVTYQNTKATIFQLFDYQYNWKILIWTLFSKHRGLKVCKSILKIIYSIV